MAGDRNNEPAPWERAAQQSDGGGWYGEQQRGGGSGAAGGARGDGYGVDDVPEPRRKRPGTGAGAVPDPRGGARDARGGRDSRAARNDFDAYDDDAANADADGDISAHGRNGGHGGRSGGRGAKAAAAATGSGGNAVGGARFNAKVVVLASTVSLLVTGVGSAAFAYQHYNSSIQTFNPGGISADRPAEAKANAAGQKPMNILLIGSDARDNGNNAFGGGATGQGARSDTSILLHIYADHQHAVGISIPRDTMVDIPACLYNPNDPKGANGKKTGKQNAMFNAAFAIGDSAQGNVACEQNTVESISGIRVDHTVVVDFEAFATITEDVGGVQVCVPNDVHDGSIQFKKGLQLVSGQTALNYVRERDDFGDGSDVSRTRRQQAFLGEMLKKVQSDGVLSDATRTSMLINGVLKSAVFDKDLGSIGALSALAGDMKGLNPANVQFLTLPGHYDGARVQMDTKAAAVIWDHLKNDQLLDGTGAAGNAGTTTATTAATTTPAAPATTAAASTVPPASIKVLVENGTKTTGLAADETAVLTSDGYNATTSHSSPAATAVTTVSYGSTRQEEAAKQVQALYPDAKLVYTKSGNATILVTLGADYAATHQKATDTTSGSAPGSAAPSQLPTEIANNSRTAADNPCQDITAGFGAGLG